MLDKVAEFYNSEVTATVEASASLIVPMLIAVIGAPVSAAVIALYRRMLSVINLLKQSGRLESTTAEAGRFRVTSRSRHYLRDTFFGR
jgi:hypothetical protein